MTTLIFSLGVGEEVLGGFTCLRVRTVGGEMIGRFLDDREPRD